MLYKTSILSFLSFSPCLP